VARERVAEEGWFGKNVLVMGLGLHGGGVEVVKFFLKEGASVRVTDLKTQAQLASSLERLRGLPVRYTLGRHEEADFLDADLVVVNPGVPKESRFLALARGIPVETEMNIVFRRCRAPITGVTGSNGKSTTTQLLGHILRTAGERVWVGGNIGRPLINRVDAIRRDDRVVLEISSFQLEDLGAMGSSPRTAVVLNITPNHLDRHRSFRSYREAKANILRFQADGDLAVLNADDPEVRTMGGLGHGRRVFFSMNGFFPEKDMCSGSCLAGDSVFSVVKERETARRVRLFETSDLPLPGRHNLQNAMAAATTAFFQGVPPRIIREGIASFEGLPHRLERVRRVAGVTYYNDSVSTTPEAVMAAIRSIPGPLALIAGGTNKGLSFAGLARVICERVSYLALLGSTREVIRNEVLRSGRSCVPRIQSVDSLEEAVRWARAVCPPGVTVLFSPGCASFDMFPNSEERGERFRDLVMSLS
jgi:UDP-N-acetylmuramoylalanine--D-glutamate ligase